MTEAAVLQLSEQLQLLRISAREYRLVSLFDSLTVSSSEATEGVLDRLMPALERGTDLPSLTLGATKRDARAMRTLLADLEARGLVDRVWPEGEAARAERLAFAHQRRFFSNFQAVGDMPDSNDTHSDASLLQGRLRDATVLVAGLGRIGSQVARALAATGVGTIVGADDRTLGPRDIIDSSYRTAELGHRREEMLGEALATHAPRTRYVAHGAPLFRGADVDLPAGLSLVALCEDGFDPDHHAAINRAALRANVPWIGYRTLRTRLEIGPTVIPSETACFHCYELRRLSNDLSFAGELELQRRLVASDADLGTLNVTLGADLMALEIVKTLTQFTSAATYGHVFVMDVVSFETHVRPILKIPRCPECGVAAKKPQGNVWRYDAETART